MRWVTIVFALIVIASCFFPWVVIPAKNIVVTGVDARGTSFGKPGYMHLLLSGLTVLLLLLKKMVAQRISIFLTAFNAAWSVRNFIVISACYGGICPEKQTALYLLLLSSFALVIANLFTGTLVKNQPDSN